MARTSRPPSAAALARSLGLSTATISNVYNRPERVSAKLRARVLAEAQRVGYTGPDPTARQLRRRRADAIGLIFTDALSFAFRDQASVGFLEGLSQACEGAAQSLLLIPAGPPRLEGNRITTIGAAAIDGVVVYSVPDDDPHLLAALGRGLPVVVVDQPLAVPGADWVGLEDRATAGEMGVYLATLGHRRIGVMTSRLGVSWYNGPADEQRQRGATYAVQRERLRGLRDGLTEAGVPTDELAVEERFEASLASGARGLDALLDRHPDITAVCCLADVLALGALEAAARRRLDVPGQLSITGYDDIPGASQAGLTTVHQPLAEKGRLAGDLLLRKIDQKEAGVLGRQHRRTLPTSLEIRATSGPPRTGS